MKLRLVTFIFCLCAFVGLIAENPAPVIEMPYPHTLVAIDMFKGTQKGQFKNDLMAVLDDGSVWKVHPTDQDKFKAWTINEQVHVCVRDSFYWFKREHKLELINPLRKESVKVMAVAFATQPLKITATRTTYLYKSSRPHLFMKPDGEYLKIWCTTDKVLQEVDLSDGSHWLVISLEVQKILKRGSQVYVGANFKDKELLYYLTAGLELDNECINWVNKLD